MHIISNILSAGLAPMLMRLVMKKDSELPWVTRLARWYGFACAAAYAGGWVAHKYMEWFL